MMRPFVAILAIAAGLIGGDTLAFGCGDNAIFSTVREDGTAVGLVLSSEQMSATPSWSPTQGEPPLGVSEASRIALDWAEGVYSRYDSVEIQSIELKRYRCWSSSNPDMRPRWYYQFDFWPVIDGNRLYGGDNFAAVLMDGSVVAPQPVDRRFP